MSKLDTAPYKGVRDFYPEDQAVQNHIFSIWRKTLESFGFEEYGASILEPAELYRAKSGEEIVNEQTFTFTDRGEREVTLRPEMTPTVARLVAQKRRDLGLPLRWYSIPNLFRYEAPQRGRLREHWQLNADMFGLSTLEADIEMIRIAHRIMTSFGARESDFEILINDRGLIENHLLAQGVDPEKIPAAIRLIDKKKKIENFEEEMTKLIGSEIDLAMLPTPDVNTVLAALQNAGITNARFEPTLMRGFDYYTGIVFEVFDTNEANPRSLFGGGRYDDLTSLFGGDQVPAVGFGSGDVTLRDFLETRGLIPEYRSTTDLSILLVTPELAQKAQTLADTLRSEGVNVCVDLSGKRLGDQIHAADKHKIPYVLVFGDNEAASGTYQIKHLPTGKETKATAEEVISIIKG